MQEAVKDAELQNRLVTFFNDKEKEHIEELTKNIDAIPGIEKLKHTPVTSCEEVGEAFETLFDNVALVPTFAFVDPFGYKGVTLKLLSAMLKDFGCDLVLFFSYNRINAALTNDIVEDHIVALFGGKERVEKLREVLKGKKPAERELLILESFSEAIKEMGVQLRSAVLLHAGNAQTHLALHYLRVQEQARIQNYANFASPGCTIQQTSLVGTAAECAATHSTPTSPPPTRTVPRTPSRYPAAPTAPPLTYPE